MNCYLLYGANCAKISAEWICRWFCWLNKTEINKYKKNAQYYGHFLCVVVDVPLSNGFIVYICKIPFDVGRHAKHTSSSLETDARGRCVTIDNPLSHSDNKKKMQINIIIAETPRSNSENIVLGEYFSFPKIIRQLN